MNTPKRASALWRERFGDETFVELTRISMSRYTPKVFDAKSFFGTLFMLIALTCYIYNYINWSCLSIRYHHTPSCGTAQLPVNNSDACEQKTKYVSRRVVLIPGRPDYIDNTDYPTWLQCEESQCLLRIRDKDGNNENNLVIMDKAIWPYAKVGKEVSIQTWQGKIISVKVDNITAPTYDNPDYSSITSLPGFIFSCFLLSLLMSLGSPYIREVALDSKRATKIMPKRFTHAEKRRLRQRK